LLFSLIAHPIDKDAPIDLQMDISAARFAVSPSIQLKMSNSSAAA